MCVYTHTHTHTHIYSHTHILSFIHPRIFLVYPFWGVINHVGGTSGKESTCHYSRHKRCEFDPWVGKIPWSRT